MEFLAKTGCIAVLIGALSACAGVPAVFQAALGGAAVARSAYCLGISEAGKQATRDAVSAGEQIILCDEPEG